MSWFSDTATRIFTPRGYNAAKGAQDRGQEVLNQLRDLWTNQENRALGYQGQFDTALSGASPIFSGVSQRLATGMNPKQPSLFMPSTPTLGSYSPDASLLEQINPSLDIGGMGENLYKARLASGTQSVADAMAGAADTGRLDAARRGARYLPSTGMDPGTYSLLRGGMEARNQADALESRYGFEKDLRAEQGAGAGTVAEMLRQKTLDENEATLGNYKLKEGSYLTGLDVDRTAREEASSDYMRDYALLMQQLGLLGSMGDMTGSSQMLGGLAGGYQNAGQGYAQLGQMQQAMWNPLLTLAGYYGGGGTKTGGGTV